MLLLPAYVAATLLPLALPPSMPQSQPICANSCRFSADGECDDGGLSSNYALCPCGSDCADCDMRWSDECASASMAPDMPFSNRWWHFNSVEDYVVEIFLAFFFCIWNSVIFSVFLPVEISDRAGCVAACFFTLFFAPFVVIGVIIPVIAGPIVMFCAYVPIFLGLVRGWRCGRRAQVGIASSDVGYPPGGVRRPRFISNRFPWPRRSNIRHSAWEDETFHMPQDASPSTGRTELTGVALGPVVATGRRVELPPDGASSSIPVVDGIPIGRASAGVAVGSVTRSRETRALQGALQTRLQSLFSSEAHERIGGGRNPRGASSELL